MVWKIYYLLRKGALFLLGVDYYLVINNLANIIGLPQFFVKTCVEIEGKRFLVPSQLTIDQVSKAKVTSLFQSIIIACVVP